MGLRVLYGVVGEGLGHATRSHVVLEHLRMAGHDLHIIASRKAFDYLSRFFANVTPIEGFEFTIDDNVLDRKATFTNFIRSLPAKSLANAKSFLEAIRTDRPDVVVSDFESFSYAYGKFHDLPIISIDNMQVLNRCRVEVPPPHRRDYLLAKAVVKNKLPNCHHYLVTTFFSPPVCKPRTTLFPPIVRRAIMEAQATEGDRVFQTSTTGSSLLEALKTIDASFVIYGYGVGRREDNLTFRDFSQEGFIRDLASSRAVIANSGFSLLSEALCLRKPYLALPVANQFEQVLNGHYLQKLGYGEFHPALDGDIISGFLERTGTYRKNLEAFEHDGNRGLLAKLDELLAGLN